MHIMPVKFMVIIYTARHFRQRKVGSDQYLGDFKGLQNLHSAGKQDDEPSLIRQQGIGIGEIEFKTF